MKRHDPPPEDGSMSNDGPHGDFETTASEFEALVPALNLVSEPSLDVDHER